MIDYTMEIYDLRRVLEIALPEIAFELVHGELDPRTGRRPLRRVVIDASKSPVEWSSVALDLANEALFADIMHVDLREVTRVLARWVDTYSREARRAIVEGGPPAIGIVEITPQEFFERACGRLLRWLDEGEPDADIKARLLGPYAAVECARQSSYGVRALLEAPGVVEFVAAFEHGERMIDEQFGAALDALRSAWMAGFASGDDFSIAEAALAACVRIGVGCVYERLARLALARARAKRIAEWPQTRVRECVGALLTEYAEDLGATGDRYDAGFDALRAFVATGKSLTAWLVEADAPASQMLDDSHQNGRVRALYYLLCATISERNPEALGHAREMLEALRDARSASAQPVSDRANENALKWFGEDDQEAVKS